MKTKRTTDPEKAAYKAGMIERYADKRRAVQNQIAALQALLHAHDEEAAKAPTNWGFEGDLGHILEGLTDLTNFLGETEKLDRR